MRKESFNNQRFSRGSLSDNEKVALCQRWKASNVSLEKFCKAHKLAKSSLYAWCKKFGFSRDVQVAKPDFVPLIQTDKLIEVPEKLSMALTCKDGIILSLTLSLTQAVALIQELSHAAAAIR